MSNIMVNAQWCVEGGCPKVYNKAIISDVRISMTCYNLGWSFECFPRVFNGGFNWSKNALGYSRVFKNKGVIEDTSPPPA